MGRHAGWLTGAAALARKYVGDNPLLIYLPETDFDVEEFLQKVHAAFEKNCNVVVCVSEGIHDKDGTFICEYDSAAGTDALLAAVNILRILYAAVLVSKPAP